MKKEDLEENMIVETLKRGSKDFGRVIKTSSGSKVIQFKDCIIGLSHWRKDLTSKGFDQEEIVSVRNSNGLILWNRQDSIRNIQEVTDHFVEGFITPRNLSSNIPNHLGGNLPFMPMDLDDGKEISKLKRKF